MFYYIIYVLQCFQLQLQVCMCEVTTSIILSPALVQHKSCSSLTMQCIRVQIYMCVYFASVSVWVRTCCLQASCGGWELGAAAGRCCCSCSCCRSCRSWIVRWEVSWEVWLVGRLAEVEARRFGSGSRKRSRKKGLLNEKKQWIISKEKLLLFMCRWRINYSRSMGRGN